MLMRTITPYLKDRVLVSYKELRIGYFNHLKFSKSLNVSIEDTKEHKMDKLFI